MNASQIEHRRDHSSYHSPDAHGSFAGETSLADGPSLEASIYMPLFVEDQNPITGEIVRGRPSDPNENEERRNDAGSIMSDAVVWQSLVFVEATRPSGSEILGYDGHHDPFEAQIATEGHMIVAIGRVVESPPGSQALLSWPGQHLNVDAGRVAGVQIRRFNEIQQLLPIHQRSDDSLPVGSHTNSQKRIRLGRALALILALVASIFVFLFTVKVNIGYLASSVSPSATNTSSGWVLTSEIVGTGDTFEFEVDFDEQATRIAISAPRAHDGKGQVEVYEESSSTDDSSMGWVKLGSSIIGDHVGDRASLGMDLSANGENLAVGYPGNGFGFVRVFSWNDTNGDDEWIQKGQTLAGPSLYSNFGASVCLSKNGNFLVVGAPLAGEQEEGMFRAYKWTVSGWIYHGASQYGRFPGDHFAGSVSISNNGDRIVVGVTEDEMKRENSGMVEVFDYYAV